MLLALNAPALERRRRTEERWKTGVGRESRTVRIVAIGLVYLTA